MYLGEDELNLLRAELMPDDNTSCTSSLATTVSMNFMEDADDLYLGAEANSFFGFSRRDTVQANVQETIEKPGRCCKSGCLIAMKELYNSYESIHSHRTGSSVAMISTVTDLIKAREVDPIEILAGMGFINNDEDKHRREVLSRFDPAPMLTDAPIKHVENKESSTSASHHPEILEESINKAQEWLSQHHESHPLCDLSEQTKIVLSGTEPVRKPALSKAIRARRKFTKSRQSSFDLLPKLKEEDSLTESENFQQEQRNYQLASALNTSIREKIADRIESCLPESAHEDLNPVKSSRLDDSESSNQHSTSNSTFLQRSDTLTQENINEIGVKLRICEPLSTRMESFELEEIISNNGEALDGIRQRLINSSGTLTNENCCSPPTLEEEFPVKCSGNTESDENESSSGFDEDDTTSTVSQAQLEKLRRTVFRHKADDCAQVQVDHTDCPERSSPTKDSRLTKDFTENELGSQATSMVDHVYDKVTHNNYTSATSCTDSISLPSTLCATECVSSLSVTLKSSSIIVLPSSTEIMSQASTKKTDESRSF